MDRTWKVELFGRLCVRQDAQAITRFRTQKTGSLLAFLAYFADRAHTREALIDRFWQEDDLDAGRNSLRVALNALRRALEPPEIAPGTVLVADRTHVRLDLMLYTTDVVQFESTLLAETHIENDAERAPLLQAAVELYREGLLPEQYDEWIIPERQRWLNIYLSALRRLVRALAQTRDYDQAIDYAWRAVRADPLREEAHRNLMRLYLAIGRPAAAQQQYRELEHLLKTELNVAPSAATQEIAKQVLQSSAPAASSAPPAPTPTPASSAEPTSSPASRARPLPAPLTRFFGREEEVALLLERVQDPNLRLITLIGPGGTGKTRLVLETMRRLQTVFAGQIWAVALADVEAAEHIKSILLDTIVPLRDSTEDPLGQIAAAIGDRPAFLALDNFEQVVEEGATIVYELLTAVPTLTCLVTSRQRLNLSGEYEFPVLPLPTPTLPGTPERLLEFASVQLFVDRARAARPDFQVTRANAAAIAALCHQLEGLPLAIELAAAWSPNLSPAQILQRLSRRFELLTSRNKDVPMRHRSLRAAIEGSFRLLSPELQHFFACLSVFRGGWTVEAAETLCNAPAALDYLVQLRERSLIQATDVGGERRFRMLETLREYATEQLQAEEAASLARQHAEFYLSLAEEADPQLLGTEQAVWLERLEWEHENLRAALAWCLSAGGDKALGLRLACSLWRFWFVRGYLLEGRSWLENALEPGAEAADVLRAKALHALGTLTWNLGDYAAARGYYEACLTLRRLVKDEQGQASTLGNLGVVALHQGDYARAQSLFEESLALCQKLGDQRGTANALLNLGNIAADQEDHARAQTLYAQSLPLFRTLGDRQGIANLLSNLGASAREQGDLARARLLFEESLTTLQELGARQGIAITLGNLGSVATDQKDFASAQSFHQQSLNLFRDLGDRHGITYALQAFATLFAAQGLMIQAVRLFGAVESLRMEIGAPLPPSEQKASARILDRVRSTLDTQLFEAAWTEGRTLTLDQAITRALEPYEATEIGSPTPL